MAKNKLLGCPFCDNPNIKIDNDSTFGVPNKKPVLVIKTIYCNVCNINFDFGSRTEKKVLEIWNKRKVENDKTV
jgi:hypothetical protein